MTPRVVEIFWLTEVVPVTIFECLEYRRLSRILAHNPDLADETKTSLENGKKEVLQRLFKVSVCDFACVCFVLRRLPFKRQRWNMVWCGIAGAVASLMSCRLHWMRLNERDVISTDYSILKRVELDKCE